MVSTTIERLVDDFVNFGEDALGRGGIFTAVVAHSFLGMNEDIVDLDLEVAGGAGIADLSDRYFPTQVLFDRRLQLGRIRRVPSSTCGLDINGVVAEK